MDAQVIPGVATIHDPVNHVTVPYVCPVETARGQHVAGHASFQAAKTWARLLIITGRCRDNGLTGQEAWWRRRQDEAWEVCHDTRCIVDEWWTP